MHKKSLLLPVVIALLVALSSPVSALEVIIDSTGKMTFYNDGVLGDSTDEATQAQKQELQLKTEAMKERHKEELRRQAGKDPEALKRKQTLEKQQLQRESDTLRKKEVESSAAKMKERPLKEFSPEAEHELRVKQQKTGVTVEVRQKNENELESLEEATPERLKVEMPAELRAEADGSESGKPAWVRQLQEERRQRIGEKIELKRAQQDGQESLEVVSREVTAKVHHSAEMIIDPETNQMSIIKPNGEVATVIHLPDQALARIEKFASVEGESSRHGRQLEIVTTEEGQVLYKLTVPKKKRLLGLIPREVETEVELNDETGEVTETAVPQFGLPGVLDSWSF